MYFIALYWTLKSHWLWKSNQFRFLIGTSCSHIFSLLCRSLSFMFIFDPQDVEEQESSRGAQGEGDRV